MKINKVKRILTSGLVAVSLIVTMTACGSKKEAKEEKTQELSLYCADMQEDEGLEMAKMFEEDTGIKLNIYAYTEDDFVQSFMVAANGGEEIDLLELNGQDVRSFVDKGLLQDLAGIEYADRLTDSAIKQYTYGDKLYGLGAFSGKTSGIYVNMDMMKEYGVEAPKTMDDLLVLRDKLAKDGKSVFGFGGGNIYMWPMWYFSTFAQTSGGTPVECTEDILKGKAKFTDANSIEAFEALRKFAEEEFWQPGFNGMDTSGGLNLFTSGQAAIYYSGTWDTKEIEASGMKNVELHEFPIIKDGATSLQPGSICDTGWSIYSKIKPEKQEAAEKFLDWVTSEETLTKFRENEILVEWGRNSVNKNMPVLDDITDLEKTKDEMLNSCTFSFLDWIYPPEITTKLQEVLQSLTGQQITSEEAGAQMQEVMDELLADGYEFNSAE